MICKRCSIDKDDSEFYKHRRRGIIKPYGVCIECTKIKSKENYDNKAEALKILKSAIGCKKCGEKKTLCVRFSS